MEAVLPRDSWLSSQTATTPENLHKTEELVSVILILPYLPRWRLPAASLARSFGLPVCVEDFRPGRCTIKGSIKHTSETIGNDRVFSGEAAGSRPICRRGPNASRGAESAKQRPYRELERHLASDAAGGTCELRAGLRFAICGRTQDRRTIRHAGDRSTDSGPSGLPVRCAAFPSAPASLPTAERLNRETFCLRDRS